MKLIKKYFFEPKCCILLLIVFFFVSPSIAQDSKFTVVLDAGHGGHDPGAMGSFTKEKDINLAVVLDLGAIIEKKFKDVKVVYTRKTDKYLTLQERADIVNNNHADLFICIHTNSSKSPSAYGAETFTLGLAKSKSNLDVAMRENSVILLEDNYKTKYEGFDPSSVESYIMFEFMQDKYIDKSVEFSSIVQQQFVSHCRRSDRGVRQAGFWVLHRSACPSVLIELGFISNPPEERYLSSDAGQNEMAAAIFNSFVDYKREHDKKAGRQISNVSKIQSSNKFDVLANSKSDDDDDAPAKVDTSAKTNQVAKADVPVKPVATVKNDNKQDAKPETTSKTDKATKQETVVNFKNNTEQKPTEIQKKVETAFEDTETDKPVFKVQIFAAYNLLQPNDTTFKGLTNVERFHEKGLNKYTVGAETDYKKIEKIRQEISSKFPDAFVIAFRGNKKLLPAETKKLMNK